MKTLTNEYWAEIGSASLSTEPRELGLRRRGSLLFGGVKSEPSLNRVRSNAGVVGIKELLSVANVFITAEDGPATDAIPWTFDVSILESVSAET